ncbi:MAG TPA: hypothetical protein VMV95_01035 [Bacillota bacterium]|nr:hypothetical protein [Bacillota bacterium]
MTKKELEKIKTIAIAGNFLSRHLIEQHNFPVEEVKDIIADISTKLHKINTEKMEKMIKKGFNTIK